MSRGTDSYEVDMEVDMDIINDETPDRKLSAPPRRKSVFDAMKEEADQHSTLHRILAVLALALFPAFIACGWAYIPISGGLVDHWALLLTTKIPITGAFWTLTSYCLTSLASPPSWKVAIISSFVLVSAVCSGQSLFLWMLLSMHSFKAWYVHSSLAVPFVIFSFIAGFFDGNRTNYYKTLGIAILLGCQMCMSGLFGWLFEISAQHSQILLCAGYPFLVLPFKVGQGKLFSDISRFHALPPEVSLVVGAVSQVFAAFPYRLIFMLTTGGDETVVLVYCVEVFFKVLLYIVPLTGPGESLLRNILKSAPGNIANGKEKGKLLGIRFGIHQLLDFNQALSFVIFMGMTGIADAPGISTLSDMSTFSRRRLMIIYASGAAIEIIIWAILSPIAKHYCPEFSPWKEATSLLLTSSTVGILIFATTAVQVLMLTLISTFEF
eukprot:TRINITY_DN8790_c1_g1_i1.p1 TRINITY_DN8790_c1_g1~~TRINITY_DN8790_c1_g1_i1.p1  ORF type:complete len:437 (+),score=34.31 TRINITY_DN8790_c1_g1_i1:87-1397(+)